MNKKNNIQYFKATKLIKNRVTYGFFSRKGGYSIKNYKSLNCNLKSDDSKTIVSKNIKLAIKNLNLKHSKIKFINQIHSSKVILINNHNINKSINADGSITMDKNISLAILTADCAPIFIYDTKNTFICALHSGWRGCLNNIISKAVKKLKIINKNNDEIVAIVGPCLQGNNFEVDENIKKLFLNKNFNYKSFFIKKNKTNKLNFDMRGLINYQLKNMSIDNIFNIDKDTYNNKDLFYSYRRSSNQGILSTARMINIIGFRK